MNWSSRWSPLRVLIFILLKCGTSRPMVALEEASFPRLIVAASHTALTGDLGVLIIELPAVYRATSTSATLIDVEDDEEDYNIENSQISSLQDPFVLRVLRLDGFESELVGEVPVQVPNVAGINVSLMIPCGLFSRGGTYSLQLQHKSSPVPDRFADPASLHEAQMRTTLDVRWPTPSLALEPQHFDTYPSQSVLATLEYTGISCSPSIGVPMPTYTVQLIYCGSSVLSCDPRNKSHVQILYTEEVKGFPVQRIITLRCEFFGLAGHYALRLKPSDANPTAPTTSAYIKVEWSDLFIFNVHARSIYPCDGVGGGNTGGVSVLFEYPACRLPGDRVRVYGRLRADVASLAPPSSLHYVAELKAPPGKHALTFDCNLFTERYIEYCFVYISQAYNGAMSEVRVDCIPTFPLQEGETGGWGQWSQWTPCSSSCVGGTRNRHRFCDTPPPRYGAKFCQGETVESELCGGSAQLDLHGTWSPGDWECRHGEGLAADRPEVTAEVGVKCRCGCSLTINYENQRKILAASSRICPGRSFWLIQTQPSFVVKLSFDQAHFSCLGQYARVRDGDSLIDELLADIAADRKEPSSGQIITTGPRLLLEFFNEETTEPANSAAVCLAGFLSRVTAIPKPSDENGTTALPAIFLNPKVMAAAGRWAVWFAPAHMAAASLLILMFLVSILLALQYAFKYRKYQVAEDLDSLTDNSACSGSMQAIAKRARAMSSSTLISEVVSLVRLSRRGSLRHTRLNETIADVERGYDSNETHAELRTFGPVSPVSEETASTSEDGRRFSATSASTSLNNVRVVPHPKRISNLLHIKGFSPASSSSNSTLRHYSGKESKDRRNRERLLQGPGSEFSLVNPDIDLELDYYDYNVVNAGAAPGSYLGMDPAFLVWIPPLTEEELDTVPAEQEEEPHYEEILERTGYLDTEGAAFTPAEYRKVKLSHQEDSSENDAEDIIRPRKLDPGERRLHDEIIMEYKARLGEGMLPIHRIHEESRTKISEESLSSAADIIPNRLGTRGKSSMSAKQPRRTRKSSRSKFQRKETKLSSESSTQSFDAQEADLRQSRKMVNDLDTPKTRRPLKDPDNDYCGINISTVMTAPRTPNLPLRNRNIVKLNVAHRDSKMSGESAVNIPLSEFSKNCLDSPAKIREKDSENRSNLTLPSPDYGVDVEEAKESFYHLVGEGEDGIKFADDDDEYIDNMVAA